MPFPKVSILIPVYNREVYLADCIQSALSQVVSDIEVVIVDNASTDMTWEICRKFAANDSRIKIFRNEKNVGPVRNWKRCFDMARGEYGKLLFSDDLIAPDYLKKTLPYLEDRSVGFVFTCVEVGPDPGLGIIKYQWGDGSAKLPSGEFIDSALFDNNIPLSPGAALFRMDDLRNNLRLTIPSPSFQDFADHGAGPDFLLYLLTATQYPFVCFVDEPLAFFRVHDESISIRETGDFIGSRYRQAKIWFASLNADPSVLHRLLAKAWLGECLRGKALFPIGEVSRRYLANSPGINLRAIFWVSIHEIARRIWNKPQ